MGLIAPSSSTPVASICTRRSTSTCPTTPPPPPTSSYPHTTQATAHAAPPSSRECSPEADAAANGLCISSDTHSPHRPLALQYFTTGATRAPTTNTRRRRRRLPATSYPRRASPSTAQQLAGPPSLREPLCITDPERDAAPSTPLHAGPVDARTPRRHVAPRERRPRPVLGAGARHRRPRPLEKPRPR